MARKLVSKSHDVIILGSYGRRFSKVKHNHEGVRLKYIVAPGETGLLVDADHPAALAEGIIQVLQDPELGIRMGEAGRERARRHFFWEHSLDRLLEAYTSLA